ncbi:MAG: serine/threonine-protein kinase [Myxococcota bacterium]
MTRQSFSGRDATGEGAVVAGRYKVDRLIARGGMATVFRAHQVGLNRPVALKVLSPPPDPDDSAAFEERFRLEAETLAQFDHPNIVTLYDFGRTSSGQFYLAMEYIDGPRLSDMLKQGPLHAQDLLPLMIQVCMGLRYAHRRGAVHRDLKPSNLLIKIGDDGEQHVKIVDFGLVKLTDDDQTITRTGLILGSPHCMAPEQVRGVDVDHRADIYAIGVLLFRCLTGEYPFHGANSAATMIAHVNEPAPRMRQIIPGIDLPDGLEDVVEICLQKNPANRFQSMNDVIDHLAVSMDVSPDAFRSMSQTHSSIRPRVMRPPPQASQVTSGVHVQPSLTWAVLAGAVSLSVTLGLVAVGGAVAVSQGWIALPQRPAVQEAGMEAEPMVAGTDEEGEEVDAPVVEEAPEPEPVKVAPPPKPVRKAQPKRSRPRVAKPVAQPEPEPTPVVAAGTPDPEPEPPTPEPEADENEKPQDTTQPPGYLGLPEELND